MEGHETTGWFRLTLLWIGTFLDNLFTSSTLSALATVFVIILTGMQIVVTYRKIMRDSPNTDLGDF